ncbi:MAG: ActS/PrrB/RegB family redox-sensitive histidine kinase [Hyphomicrobium aestuarii]|nr:ActS/PrrB/RegB family redox-sensitive histidine kinase [Hyphomicrobium aestuarii]
MKPQAQKFATAAGTDSRLRLVTTVRLRWIAVLGQLITVTVVALWFEFPLPLGPCLAFIAISAWLNVFLALRFSARHRLSSRWLTVMLAYDLAQLSALLYLTGGMQNPFSMLIIVPVTVSAGSLPARHTLLLGAMTVLAILALHATHYPLPWYPGLRLDLPQLYQNGMLAAVAASLLFMSLYAWRLARESRQMSAALAATDMVLAREQKLHALDGLAAAAAHELGTPLSTIVLVAKELERDPTVSGAIKEDLELLRSQALRCREILQKLTRRPSEQDPLHGHLTVREMIDEAANPYRNHGTAISIHAGPKWPGGSGPVSPMASSEPVGLRSPGVIYGLGNIIENAIDFALERVEIRAEWNEKTVEIAVMDDGPGFPVDLIDTLGEPYVTTRISGGRMGDRDSNGLGLGFFIANTLLERSGASVQLANREAPKRGAVVRIIWPRSAFDAPAEGRTFLPGANRTPETA